MSGRDDRAAALYARIRECDLCPLARTRTLAVPGEGRLNSEVMFIGEAPGMNEDRQGRPFVGQAGQFLGELLAAAGLERNGVYICNVLKCRPPNNRDPLPGEIDACRDYLDEQIALVDPLLIVTLGRFSMARWFPGQSISRIHGRVVERDGRLIVPMYHPAAALHQQALRTTIIHDFESLPAVLEQARRRTVPTRAADPAPATPGLAPAPEPQATAAQMRLFE
ncbi:MAG: uracil-DNA glycosylase [Dehalococcoidia bacterium]|nr:uracil-DNA glycosylase [Chloroflexi bacterium CFX7]MCK6564343.1 uracil-DNA glycosylase [Dehalococcoidia bacterium]NUQ55742.1 uracil-DNA glycosylase [Dehalococcoidia bacterium]RIL01549.1 MAG: uracil-DNA glycosylase [bacterium]